MDQMQHNKASLFLMELIISILFFAISGTVCVQLFVNAHTLSDNSININNASLWIQNISEVFYRSNGKIVEVADFFPENAVLHSTVEGSDTDGTMIMFFDEDWDIVDYPTADTASQDANYEVLFKTSTHPASEVYKDTEADFESIEGNAVLGEIAVLKISKGEIVTEFSKMRPLSIISYIKTDYYLGK